MRFLEIQLTPPFDAALSMRVWTRHPLEQIDTVEDGIYSRLFMRPWGPVLLSWEPKGTIDKPSLELSWSDNFNQEEDLSWAMELTRWIFSETAPIQQFYAHVKKSDPTLYKLTQQLRGLRPPQSPSLFEIMIFAIVGQQVNLNFAYKNKASLEDAYAQKIDIHGRQWVLGLRPEDFQNATVEEMREMQISNNKARAILELAETLSRLPLDRDTLSGLSAAEIAENLTILRGIGPWTAQYALMRALGEIDALPVSDAGLRAAMMKVYDLDERPSTTYIEEFAERWRPYRSLAVFYLWSSLSM